MSESLQHKLDRVRRPRVQVTYDVETGGAEETKELPFVVGVVADLSGQPDGPKQKLKDKKFVPIDRDNFNSVLSKSEPRVAMKVDDTLSGDEDSKLSVELRFNSMDDFEPAQVVKQVPALKELLDMRNRLDQLLSKMEGNDELADLLSEVVDNADKKSELAEQLGVNLDGDAAE